MNIAISGSTGFVGSRLVPHLEKMGHTTLPIVRGHKNTGQISYNPVEQKMAPEQLDDIDTIIHLAGKNVATFWTEKNKGELWNSRINSTKTIVEALKENNQRKRTLLCTTGIGIYGDRGDELLYEESTPGNNFLSRLACAHEDIALSAQSDQLRVITLRVSMVLSPAGGALKKMLPAFKLGLGGRLGTGKQWVSWISLEDLTRVISTCITDATLKGPVNACTPHPVSNLEFTKALGGALRRPTLIPAPAFMLRLILGEMADNLLLCSQKVSPKRLLEKGFVFNHPKIDDALACLSG